MTKRMKHTSGHLGGSKGVALAQRLGSTPLEKILIVPIEIGKSHHKACVADYMGAIHQEPFEFHNSPEGIRCLDKRITKVSTAHQAKQIVVGLEATGHYYQWPAACLYEQGYTHLFVLNPLSTAQCHKAGLTWSKTDDVDLRAIGQALLNGYGTLYHPEQPLWDDLRELGRYRRFQVGHQTALKNKIHGMLDRMLPGITQLDVFAQGKLWHPASLAFLAKYPKIDRIAALKAPNILHFLRRRGRRVTPQEAHQLLQWTQKTFGTISTIHPTREHILQSLLVELEQLSKQIAQLEVKLLGYLVRIPAVVLLSIDYVGPIRASELAGELSPFDPYLHSRAVIKAAGLDPTRFQSSTFEATEHPISKKGSIPLRYISLEIGSALMKHNDYFAYYAHRLLERGKSQNCACVATTTRFLRVAFWMIKEKRTFQPQNGLGVSQDPLGKITRFLQARQASEHIDAYVQLAQRYLAPSDPKEAS